MQGFFILHLGMQTTAGGNIESQFFPALTGVRAFTAYLVYLCHFVFFYPSVFSHRINCFFSEFYVSVAMFFVLSGFLITYRYYSLPKFNFRNYMVKRFARVYPMYFILTTLFFVYLAVGERQFTFFDFKLYLLNISMLKGFFYDFFQSGIAPGWSLTLEEIFYFMVPALFVLMRKRVSYLFVVPVVFLVTGLILVRLVGVLDLRGFLRDDSFMFNYTIFGRISEFIAGIFLAVLFKKYHQRRDTKYFTYFGLGVIFLGVYVLSIKESARIDRFEQPFGKLLNTFVIPIFGILPFYWGLVTEKTLISKIFSSKLLQVLGKSSYVFYLIHIWFLIVMVDYGSHSYFVEFLMLNVIAVLLYYSLEKPLEKLIRVKMMVDKAKMPGLKQEASRRI